MANDFLATLRRECIRAIAAGACGVPVDAQEIAEDIVRSVQHQHQGEQPYIPSSKYNRDDVLRDFTGANHDAVCAKHQISRSTLKRIVKSARQPKPVRNLGSVST